VGAGVGCVVGGGAMMRDEMKIVQVAMGANHVLALRANGTVVVWGSNEYGQCDVPAGLGDVVQVAAGWHSLALTRAGQVVSWGKNDESQCDVPVGLGDVIQVDAGDFYSIALTRQGQVVAWGNNKYSQCDVPVGLSEVIQVTSGSNYSLALTRQGQVVAWGDNEYSQCDVPVGLGDVIQVDAGDFYSIALTRQGQVVAWGNNKYSQCDIPVDLIDVIKVITCNGISIAIEKSGRIVVWGNEKYTRYLSQDSIKCNLIAVFAHRDHDYGLSLYDDGYLTGWGNRPLKIHDFLPYARDVKAQARQMLIVDSSGIVHHYDIRSSHLRKLQIGITDVMQVAMHGHYACIAVNSQGQVYAWDLTTNEEVKLDELKNEQIVQVAAGWFHLLFLTSNGMVLSLGNNIYGQCEVPKLLQNVVQIAAGFGHSFALTNEGDVVLWGRGSDEELKIPVGLRDVAWISSHNYSAIAVTKNGEHSIWGELGFPIPSHIGRVEKIVIGDFHGLVINFDGTVSAWGDNNHGQCDVPIWLRGVAKLAAGWSFSLAILHTGQLVSWGGHSVADTDRLIQIGTAPRLQYIHPFAAYEGGEAKLFSTPSGLLKKYHTPEKTPALAKLQHIIAHPVTLTHADRPLIIWPQKLAYHPFTGELAGYVMPFVAATPLIDVLDRTKRLARWPDLATDTRREWQFVLTVARWSAAVLAYIHAHGYVVGDLSPRNILVYEEGTVAFVDCDSYQVGDGSVYGCSVSTAGYHAPEVRQRAHGRLQYSIHSDAFALAVVIFRLVCGNLHPYQGITLPSAMLAPAQYHATKQQYPHLQPIPDGVDATTYCYERGIWPYDATQQLCVPPVEMQAYYLQLPAAVRGLFGRAFTGAPAQRPTPLEWVQVLDAWLEDV
jgi:alpha-tubulin suppressor-like RCC1 family protein